MSVAESRRQFMDRQMLKQILAKHTVPAQFEQSASLFARMFPQLTAHSSQL